MFSAFMDYREVLVAGGTGFVGRHVCRALIARGHLPRLLVRVGSEDRIPEDIRTRCRITLGDATVAESVENAAQGTVAIVNLVGIIREVPAAGITYERLHVDATRNAVSAAVRWGIPRFIQVSALGAAAGGTTGYFDTKGRAEEIVRGSGLAWTLFRPSIIFGPGDRFIGELAAIARKVPFIPVPGDGRYRLQPVFVGDVVKGIVDALSRPDTEGRSFDVGGPERFSYDDLLDGIAAAVGSGRRARKAHVPLSFLRPLVRRLERFRAFPLSIDQLEMLCGGSVCEPAPYYSAFGFSPLSLSEYLSVIFPGEEPILRKEVAAAGSLSGWTAREVSATEGSATEMSAPGGSDRSGAEKGTPATPSSRKAA